VTALRIEQAPAGVLVTAVGLPQTQGYFEVSLDPVTPEDGARPDTLIYELRAVPPAPAIRTSTPQSRELQVGTYISDAELRGVRTIEVRGLRNKRTVRRR
jgi:hypothetical protein